MLLRIARLALSLGIAIAASATAEPVVFHSPNDDALPGAPGLVLAPGAHTLHLYIATGATASSADPCNQGDGAELCGWQLEIETSGAAELDGFIPTGDAAMSFAPSRLRIVGGDAVAGGLGALKVGDLSMHAGAAGGVSLASGKSLDTSLVVQAIAPSTLVAVPESDAASGMLLALASMMALRWRRRWVAVLVIPAVLSLPASADLDADGVEDAQDVCPTRYDPGQEDSGGLDTVSPNGVGDACECGDVNGDGVTDLVDVARLQRHHAGLESLAAPAKCPGDACDATSIGLLRQALADEAPPATCAAASALACFDPFEANDARAASRYLGSHSDAGTGGAIVATLPPGDDDWFSFRLVDDAGSFEPFAVVSTPAADYDACFYIDCDSGDTASIDCLAGQPASVDGVPGCCSTSAGIASDSLEASVSCGGFGTPEDSTIYVRVFRASSVPAACGPYTLEFGG